MRSIWECGIQSGHLAPETKRESVRSVLRRASRHFGQPRYKRGLPCLEKRWVLDAAEIRYGSTTSLRLREVRSSWECGTQSGHLAPETKLESVRSVVRRAPRHLGLSRYTRGLAGPQKLWVLCAVEARYGTTTSLRLRDMRSIWERGIRSGDLAPETKFESVRSVLRRALKINGSDI